MKTLLDWRQRQRRQRRKGPVSDIREKQLRSNWAHVVVGPFLILSFELGVNSVDPAHRGARWGQKAAGVQRNKVSLRWQKGSRCRRCRRLDIRSLNDPAINITLCCVVIGCNFYTFLTGVSVWHVCVSERLRENVCMTPEQILRRIKILQLYLHEWVKQKTFLLLKDIFQALSSKRILAVTTASSQK